MDRSLLEHIDENIEFNISSGWKYLWCCWSLVSSCAMCPFPCIAIDFMKTQKLVLKERHLHYQANCCCSKTDKIIPYDRLQDVNINQNCCHRVFGVADVVIQNAGENIIVVAPLDEKKLRDLLISKRDSIVHGPGRSGGDGLGGRTGGGASTSYPLLASPETIEIKNSLSRIELLLQKGLEKLEERKY